MATNAPTDPSCDLHKILKVAEADKPRIEAEALRALEDAAMMLVVNQPFFGSLFVGLERVVMWNIPTAGVDGVHIFYNPAFIMSLTSAQRKGLMCHEVLHLAFSHLHRRKGRVPGKWNAAADYAVNLVVIDTQLELPRVPAPLLDDKFKDDAAEEIYSKLTDKPSQMSGKKKHGCDKGDGEGDNEGEGDGDDGCPECGEGDAWDSMDRHFDPAIDESDLVDMVVRAYEQTKNQGKLPGSLDAYIRNLREPTVPWNEFMISRSIDIFNREEYMWERRNRMSDVIAKSMRMKTCWIPGLAKEEQRNLAVFIDSSGSISDSVLEAFASEVAYIMTMASNTYVCVCDAAVQEFVEVTNQDDLLASVKFSGRGGTDFRPPFAELKKRDIVPELCIYLTDGYGTFPEEEPAFPVIWAFTEEHGQAPAWGEKVIVKGTK